MRCCVFHAMLCNLGLCLMHSMHLINLITTQELLQLFSCRKDHGDSTINCCQSDRQIDTITSSRIGAALVVEPSLTLKSCHPKEA